MPFRATPTPLEPLEDRRVGHSAALAQRLQLMPTVALFERVHQCRYDPRAAGSQRVADRDCAAVDVGLGQVSAGVGGLCHDQADYGSLSLRCMAS